MAAPTDRSRLGPGARFDAEGAPHNALLQARRATAYFARLLNDLPDAALFAPSGDGRTRAHVVAGVSYHARALTRVLAGLRAGQAVAMYDSDAARRAELARGATLPARALRSLFQHSEVHLNVEWRDLSDAQWQDVAAAGTPRDRAVVLWRSALALDAGGRAADVPEDLRTDVLAGR